jgi:tetratricopeptide (TPR) repeat protein
MRGPLSEDDIERLEQAGTPEAHRSAATTLTAWAEEPHEDDEASTARLLNAAAWHLDQAGDREAALALYRRSVTAPGTVVPDKRCYLHGALLQAGRTDEARRLGNEIRRSVPEDLEAYAFVAENHELAGDVHEAHRWLELGAQRLERDGRTRIRPDGDLAALLLLRARRRVRQNLGFPPDHLDELVPPIDPSVME